MCPIDSNLTLIIINSSINFFFFLDIFINFFSAYYDTDFNLIDDKKVRLFTT